uniref:NADH-ubiquinone oxidoreductase chain 1 n=1 Tax=Diddensiella santjacobensis TaxID=2704139 RepID=S5TE14_9ASCO|nr:NADH dehydrogenase subunit 1 [Diddensiella santjacobensis]AGS44129.1 NADH dehydrogenase subunit 1 [Diddensiella santjacobensis]
MEIFIDIIEILVFFIAILFSIAYFTVAERKTLAYMQRRIGPNTVGIYGMLQAFADAIKLLVKEILIPSNTNKIIYILSPCIALLTALLGWLAVPISPITTIEDMQYGILYIFTIGSIGIFGTLLSGWSSNSKYAMIGSIRATVQLISYELVLTTIFIICILLNNTMNISMYIYLQKYIWLLLPLLPLFIMYFISTIAETNRPPFDLVEAESELVAGFFTEYGAGPFVYFFLAEYSNIIIMCTTTTILFLGGYNILLPLQYVLYYIAYYTQYTTIFFTIEGLLYGISFICKIVLCMYTFVWLRATYPRFTYDNLINFCWVVLLPLLFGLIIFIPAILYTFDMLSAYTL